MRHDFNNFTWSLKMIFQHQILFIIILLVSCLLNAEPRILGFDEALRIADNTHPDIRVVRSRIRELGFKQRQNAAGMLPQADASASYNRLGFVPPGKKYLLGESNNDLYADINARQALYDGGRYRTQKTVIEKQTELEEQKLELVRRNIRTAVARAWLEAMRARYGVAVQQDLISGLREQQAIAELLYSSGKVSDLDILRIKTQILSAEGILRSLTEQLAAKHFALAQAMGISDSVSVSETSGDSITLIEPPLPPVCDALVAAEQSPEVMAAIAAHGKSVIDERLALAALDPGCSYGGKEAVPPATAAQQKKKPSVKVITVKQQQMSVSIKTGVRSNRRCKTTINAPAEGTVESLKADEGDTVGAGTVLRYAVSTDQQNMLALARSDYERERAAAGGDENLKNGAEVRVSKLEQAKDTETKSLGDKRSGGG